MRFVRHDAHDRPADSRLVGEKRSPLGLAGVGEQHPLRSTCRPLLVLCAALKSAFYPTNSFLLLYATPQLEGTILHPGVQAKYRGVTLTPLHFNGSFISHPQLSNNLQVLLILPRAPPGRTCGFPHLGHTPLHSYRLH